MKNGIAMRFDYVAEFCKIIDRTNLIIHMHQRNQRRIGAQSLL